MLFSVLIEGFIFFSRAISYARDTNSSDFYQVLQEPANGFISDLKNICHIACFNTTGDLYLLSIGEKSDCLVHHLDKKMNPKGSFFTDNGIHAEIKVGLVFNVNVDFDSKGNIFATDMLKYIIFHYDKIDNYINKFSDPGPDYIGPDGNPPRELPEPGKWLNSFTAIFRVYTLEGKYLIVIFRKNVKQARIFYDLYTLDGKRVSNGSLQPGTFPVGKDNLERLVCKKTDISGDGTEVTNWLYLYSVKK